MSVIPTADCVQFTLERKIISPDNEDISFNLGTQSYCVISN